MEQLTLRNIFIYSLIFVIFFNLMNGIGYSRGVAHYMIAILPYSICLVLLVVIQHNIIEAIVLFIVGAVVILFNKEFGDLTSSIFFVYGCVILKNKAVCAAVLAFTFFAICAKYMSIGGPITRAFNDIVGFSFVYLVGYVIYRDLKNGQSR